MTDEKVSVIVPVYNVEKYLHRCLDSIINQTYRNLEIILVDDGSPDNSGAICDEYAAKDKRIRVIHQENGGVSSARNTGIRAAKSEYIFFVDADDSVTTEYISSMMALNEDADLVVSSYYDEKEPSVWVKSAGINIFSEQSSVANSMSIYEPVIKNAVYSKRFKNSIIKNTGIEMDCTMNMAEDGVFVYKYLSKCNTIQFLDSANYYYWNNNASAVNRIQVDCVVCHEKLCIEISKFFKVTSVEDEEKLAGMYWGWIKAVENHYAVHLKSGNQHYLAKRKLHELYSSAYFMSKMPLILRHTNKQEHLKRCEVFLWMLHMHYMYPLAEKTITKLYDAKRKLRACING